MTNEDLLYSTDRIDQMNHVRKSQGFLTLDQLLEVSVHNKIFDVFSTLISETVRIGKNNLFYPQTIIQNAKGTLSIGDSNTFYSGTMIECLNGSIEIGNHNEIGKLTTLIQSIQENIFIQSETRIMGGAQILDGCFLGNGSQVLGSLKVRHCSLAQGESYKEKNPNLRGGVLKGFGVGNDLKVDCGWVINGSGVMTQEMIEKQETYHPNWRKTDY